MVDKQSSFTLNGESQYEDIQGSPSPTYQIFDHPGQESKLELFGFDSLRICTTMEDHTIISCIVLGDAFVECSKFQL